MTQILPFELMLPAPGQGALAVQCREEPAVLHWLAPLEDPATRAAVTAERAFLHGLGGGCAVPIAAYACIDEAGQLQVQGRVTALAGHAQVDVMLAGPVATADRLGQELAQLALAQGAGRLLAEAAP